MPNYYQEEVEAKINFLWKEYEKSWQPVTKQQVWFEIQELYARYYPSGVMCLVIG